MKKCNLRGIGALLVASLFVACSDDFRFSSDDATGRISFVVALDTETVISRSSAPESNSSASRAGDITVNDLSLRLTKADGSDSWSWASVDEFPREKEFAVGDYKLEAFYGDVNQQGFDLPSYYGSQDITVADGKTTNTSLTATMSKSMITLKYTDAFQNYMADWGATVNGVSYDKEEIRPVYVTPGDVDIRINVKKPNGLSAELVLDPVPAVARYHYTVTVDVNNGNVGDVQLVVSFDENFIDTEDVLIDLSDKLLTTPAPVADADGFVSGVPVEVIGGITGERHLAMNLVAMAGLKSVTLTTVSPSLIANGWPAQLDLMAADAMQQASLTSLGLSVLGLWKTPGEMAVIDLSDVIKNISAADTETSFTVIVKDKLLRESEPLVLALDIEDIQLDIATSEEYFSPGTPLEVTVGFNGDATTLKENLSIEYKHPISGSWRATSIVSVSDGVSRAMSDYTVTITAPDVTTDLELRAKSGNSVSKNTVTVKKAPYAVTVNDWDVYATHAYVSVVGTDGTPDPSTDNLSFSILAPGSDVYQSVSHTIEDGKAHITALTPGAEYKIKASVDGLGTQSATFITEDAAAVPNGDFEDIFEAYTGSGVRQGGQWRRLATNNYNTADFTFSEATGWATTNFKTMNGKTVHVAADNTWFNQPSVFSTSLSYLSTVPNISMYNGGGSDTPSAYNFTAFEAHSGSKAIVIRNVAWDAAGSVPSASSTGVNDNDNHYNHTVPNVANVSVGKMFLGTYSYADGVETYNQGVSFISRPVSLTGWYTYAPDNGDTDDHGVVTVELLAGGRVIATGSADLTAASSFTQFTANLTYTVKDAKATTIRIMVASSKYSGDLAYETQNVKVTDYNSRYESYKHGATLVVDDFKFVY